MTFEQHPMSEGTDYDAEAPVNIRSQRLRPAADPVMRLRAAKTDPAHAEPETVPDPYGVGQDNLSAPEPELSTQMRADAREQQLRALLGTPAGVEVDPAQWGWRGKANALLGGSLRVAPKRHSREVAFRLAVQRIRQPLPGTPVVTVANVKGGTGVTPTTLLLSNTFGIHRSGGVVAWDNNEARGTLAARAAEAPRTDPTVWDVLANARALCSPNADASGLSRFLRLQPTRDEILASDQSSKRLETIGWDECAAIMAVLRRHRSMVIVDTGNNERASNFGWSIAHTTQLVIPLTYRRDATHSVLRMLDAIAAQGYEHLVASAVVVLADGTAPDGAARNAVLTALDGVGITRITHVPFDPVLAGGDRIVHSRLSEATVRAWTDVAAVVADAMSDDLAHREVSLETTFIPESRRAPAEYDTRTGNRDASRDPTTDQYATGTERTYPPRNGTAIR